VGRALGILVAVATAWALTTAGCGGSQADMEADAGESVLDAGASDAGDAGDAGGAGRDAAPFQFTPAACDDGDGGVYQPPWGCPDACTQDCEGDTMCTDYGHCERRSDCYEWCEVELTVHVGLLWEGQPMRARVCNRGAMTAGKGSTVTFDIDGEVLCEATIAESLEPCECAVVRCEAYASARTWVSANLQMNPDDQYDPCGNPLGHTVTAVVTWPYE
jgi:hypothetical protein